MLNGVMSTWCLNRTLVALVDNTARDYFNYSVFGSRVRHEHPSNGRAVTVDAHTAPLQVDTGVAWQLLQEHQPALCAHLSDMGVDGMMTTNKWLLTMFCNRFPPHVVVRFWDWIVSVVSATTCYCCL